MEASGWSLAAERKGLDIFGVIVIASVTAIGGGTVRDLLLNRHPIFWIADPRYLIVIAAAAVLTADIPLILRRDIYATAAIAGVALYLVLRALGMKQPWAFGIGMAAVVFLRLLAIRLRWQLPTFNR